MDMEIQKQTPPVILVAEDDVAMRDIMQHKLVTSGYTVQVAEDGKQAIELIPKLKPQLVMLDLLMPEVDGFGVLEFIRKNPDTAIAKTKVIVLSNLWSNADILRVKALSVQDYLVKAYFTPEEILEKVQAVLG